MDSTWTEVTDVTVIPEGVTVQEYGYIGINDGPCVDKVSDDNIDFVTLE